MADAPNDRRYLETHEWHKLTGQVVTIGISAFAADELTDITFVDLPKVGTKLAAGERLGEIESVKASSDLYCGVTGEVVQVNDELTDNPGLINSDPYEAAWMVKVKVSDTGEVEKLLSAQEYLKKVGQ